MGGTWCATARGADAHVYLLGTGIASGGDGWPVHLSSPTEEGISSPILTGQRLLPGLLVFLVLRPNPIRDSNALLGWEVSHNGALLGGAPHKTEVLISDGKQLNLDLGA